MRKEKGNISSAVAARFSAAASTYHPLANIQRRVAVKLMKLMPPCPAPPRILEIGCGTGLLTAMLACAFPTSQIDAIDISSAMIKKARDNLTGNKLVNWRTGDACRLPKNKKYPLIVSNCVLHWIAPIELIIGKIRSLLARDGRLACAIMVRGTLAELNSSRNRIAAHKPARVALPAENEARRAINKAGLRICAENSETIRSEYSSAAEMLKQLHDQGLTGGNIPRNKTLLTRSELSRLIADYSKHYKGKKGVYASYRVFYCVAAKAGTALRAVRGAQGTARPACLMHSSPRQTAKLKGDHS